MQVQIQEVEQKVDVIRRKEDELESATGQMDSYAVLTRILTSFSAKRKGAAGRSQELAHTSGPCPAQGIKGEGID